MSRTHLRSSQTSTSSAPRAPAGGSGTIKDPDDWVTGDEAMTGAQRSYLETLAREAGETLPADLTKAEASEHIDRLQGVTGRGTGDDQGATARPAGSRLTHQPTHQADRKLPSARGAEPARGPLSWRAPSRAWRRRRTSVVTPKALPRPVGGIAT